MESEGKYTREALGPKILDLELVKCWLVPIQVDSCFTGLHRSASVVLPPSLFASRLAGGKDDSLSMALLLDVFSEFLISLLLPARFLGY